jgi:hypothetical protein
MFEHTFEAANNALEYQSKSQCLCAQKAPLQGFLAFVARNKECEQEGLLGCCGRLHVFGLGRINFP